MTHDISYRRLLSKMGYYNYQNGLIYRHLNQEGGWDKHLEHCRNFILKSIDFYNPEKITVLGSGWLLELPIAEMIEKVDRICLVDIIHPPDVIRQVGSIKNIELSEQDVTGGLIEEVWQKAGKHSFLNKLKSLDDINIPEYNPVDDPGMVVSLNILTQLESLLIRFIRKKSAIKEEEYIRFRVEVQKKHLDFLRLHKSVLITDFEEIITDKSGSNTTVSTLVTELPQAHLRNEWTWNFDLAGADYYNKRSLMKVVALTF
jgi:hypothetical protein